jgi:hypothetical protein
MQITIACGLDLRSRAGFWKNDGSAVHAVRTIQYNNLFYLLLIHQICCHHSELNHYPRSDEIAHACSERSTLRFRDDSSVPGIASHFNASVTSDIIQPVTLWARGG